MEKNPEFEITKAEKWAFYMYGFASEPFSSAAMAIFIPIILETYCSNYGYEMDRVTKCDNSIKDYNCGVFVLGVFVNVNSYVLLVTCTSVLIQLALFGFISGLADYGNYKKKLLVLNTVLGSLCSILFLTVKRYSLFWLLSIFAILGNFFFGASYIYYYAYVSDFTNNDPAVLNYLQIDTKDNDHIEKKDELQLLREKIGNGLSGKGFAMGYLAGVIVMIMVMLYVKFFGGVVYNLQISVAFVGLWWLLFSSFTFIYLKSRPGLELSQGENIFTVSIKKYLTIFKRMRELSNVFKLLLAWFFISDSLSSIVSVTVLVAKQSLKMEEYKIMSLSIIAPFFAAIGNIFFNYIQSRFDVKSKKMIKILTILHLLLSLYNVFGLVKQIPFGLKHENELYIIGVLFGFILGAIQSFIRVQYSELIPKNKDGEFFGLYQISDKGSTWFGTLMIAVISHYTNNIRFGYIFIFMSFFSGLLLVIYTDVEVGKLQAKRFV